MHVPNKISVYLLQRMTLCSISLYYLTYMAPWELHG